MNVSTRTIDLGSDEVCWLGAHPIRKADGWQPMRLPVSEEGDVTARPQRPFRERLLAEARLGAGVRLRIETDAQKAALTLSALPGRDDDQPLTVDVVVDGEIVDTAAPVDAAATPIVFELTLQRSGPEIQTVDIWLPFAVPIVVQSLDLSSSNPITVQAPAPTSAVGARRWIAYGSSITFGRFAASPARSWSATVARELDLDLINLGFAGQALLDPSVAREIASSSADVVSVCSGINVHNQAAMSDVEYRSALRAFIADIRDGLPDATLIVVSPISSPSRENARSGPSFLPAPARRLLARVVPPSAPSAWFGPTLSDLRRATHEIVAERQMTGDQNLHLIDGLDVFGAADAPQLVDGLHPGPDGHDTIAAAFTQQLRSLLPRC